MVASFLAGGRTLQKKGINRLIRDRALAGYAALALPMVTGLGDDQGDQISL
jgi:hypothetical protein